ncbi:hypothetical protein RJ641_012688 [Dillenia turbinata]|uniref:Uncharacterized protein n=1 Tax=Dillenia turbinata TaxID=194707 RepID=A0AAN8V2M0_9MAGN
MDNYQRRISEAFIQSLTFPLPVRLMEDFLELARHDIEKDLETCGVLGAFLVRITLFISHPATWSSTAVTCKTHPSQICFMSSVDLHTQYPYQVMVPEAIAIVMAPIDTTRCCGIFRLSEYGMGILREYQGTGFHPHTEPADGSPIYENCSNVYTKIQILDLKYLIHAESIAACSDAGACTHGSQQA